LVAPLCTRACAHTRACARAHTHTHTHTHRAEYDRRCWFHWSI